MRHIRIIPSLVAAVLLTAFLAGSGGITFIIHRCNMSDKTTVSTFSALNSNQGSETCCGMSGEKDDSGNSSLSANCCDYKTSHLTVSNYLVKAIQHSEVPVSDQPLLFASVKLTSYNISVRPSEWSDKHGGRFVINSNCQLIS